MRYYILVPFFLLLLTSCDKGINDRSKRNEHWVWWVDDSIGKGKWLPVGQGDQTKIWNGNVTTFYSNGNIWQVSKIRNNKPCDTIFRYDINGHIDAYIFPSDTKKSYFFQDGRHKIYFQNGKIWGFGVVKNHIAWDEWTEFYENSKPAYYYKLSNNRGSYNEFYENGNYKCKIIGEFRRSQREQKWEPYNASIVSYYENGKNKFSGNIVDSLLDGKVCRWYEDGTLRSVSIMRKGIQDGRECGYFKNGNINFICNFKNGKFDGKYKVYDSTGKFYGAVIFKDGRQLE